MNEHENLTEANMEYIHEWCLRNAITRHGTDEGLLVKDCVAQAVMAYAHEHCPCYARDRSKVIDGFDYVTMATTLEEIVETVEFEFLPHRSDYSSVEELEAAVIADYESFARLRAEYEADVVGTEW